MNKEILLFVFVALVFFTMGYYTGRDRPRPESVYREKINILRQNKQIDEYFKHFPIYYINLDRSVDRNESFINEMKSYDVQNYVRVSAIDGKEIDRYEYGEVNGIKYKANSQAKKVQLAVTLSHIRSILEGHSRGHENIMVMEDDAEMTLVPYWKKSLETIIGELPEDCDILLLSNHRHVKEKTLRLIKINSLRDFNGVCYIVTKRGMDKISKRFHPPGSDVDIDLTPISNNVFDCGFLGSLDVYTYNVTHFLLENFKYRSTVSNDSAGTISNVQNISRKVLDHNSFLV